MGKFGNTKAYDKNRGGGIEFGAYYYLPGLGMINKSLIPGFDVTFVSLGTNFLRKTETVVEKQTYFDPIYNQQLSQNIPVINDSIYTFTSIGVKAGPAITFNPVGKIFLDIFYKFHPVASWERYKLEKRSDQYQLIVPREKDNIGGFGLKYSLGVNARLSLINAGIEFDLGKVDYSIGNNYNQLKKMNTFILWLGVNF